MYSVPLKLKDESDIVELKLMQIMGPTLYSQGKVRSPRMLKIAF